MSAHGFRMLASADEVRAAFDADEHVEVTARENIDGRVNPDRLDMEAGEGGWQREHSANTLDYCWDRLYYRARPANWCSPPLVVEERKPVDVLEVTTLDTEADYGSDDRTVVRVRCECGRVTIADLGSGVSTDPLSLANRITKALYPDLYGQPGLSTEQVALVMGCRGVVHATLKAELAGTQESRP